MTIITRNIRNNDELRIFPYIEEMSYDPCIHSLDFTLIGLVNKSPNYGLKGIKIDNTYCNDADEVVVKKSFDYVATGVNLLFEWYKHDGTVGVSKSQFKPLNVVEIHKIEKANRDRTISYLHAAAIGTPIEMHVTEVLKHYKEEIDLFIYNNTDDLINAVMAEPQFLADGVTPNPIWNYLRIVTQPPDHTVYDTIVEQIS